MTDEMTVMDLYEKYCDRIKSTGSSQYTSLCPFPDHPDRNPSFSFNTLSTKYYCFGCSVSGNAITFAQFFGEDPTPFYSDDYKSNRTLINNGKTTVKNKTVTPKLDLTDKAEEYHENLGENYDNEFYAQRVGWHKKRLTFPYFNNDGDVIGIKHHKKYWEGDGEKKWYLEWMLDDYDRNEPLIICEGEKDAVIMLKKYNVLSGSGGCSTIPGLLNSFKEFKKPIILYDKDEAGQIGADKLAQAIYDELNLIVDIAQWGDELPNSFDPSDDKDLVETIKAINNRQPFQPSKTNGKQTVGKQTGVFEVITDIEATNTTPKPTEWLVENVLPKGSNSILAGTTGSKKSYYVMQLGMSVANGESKFMGHKIPNPNLKVLYVDTEIGIDELLRRYHRLKGKIDWQDNGDWMMMTKSGVTVDIWDEVHNVIENRFKPDLLIIDSLYNSTAVDDFSKPTGISRVTNALCEFKDRYGCTMQTVGHFNKGNNELGLDISRMNGASQLQNWIEWNILMCKTNVPNFNLWKVGKTRHTYHDESIIGIKFNDFWFETTGVVDEEHVKGFLTSEQKKANWQTILDDLPDQFDTSMWKNVFSTKFPHLTDRTAENWLRSCKETPLVDIVKTGIYKKGLTLIDEENVEES